MAKNYSDSGVFSKITARLSRNRLGELLVMTGHLKPSQLRDILTLQKDSKAPLGQILVENDYMSPFQLRTVLVKQFALRYAMTAILFVMTLSGFSAKKAKADIPDTPAKISLSASDHFTKVSYYPGLFGADEEKSANLQPFTKWTGMFARFEKQLQRTSAREAMKDWARDLDRFSDMPLKRMASKVNDFVNQAPYILDDKLWDKSDYWATPVEFLERGGDCEDFAIAKYTALRVLGVPEERLRVAIVQDQIKNIPHAVLVVYTDQGPVVLDNQIKKLVDGSYQDRYRPIFSINRQAWWLHTAPEARTVLASADRD